MLHIASKNRNVRNSEPQRELTPYVNNGVKMTTQTKTERTTDKQKERGTDIDK